MSSQERLLEAGLELFHRYGIYPVGLDRILSHAGVTKTTFYKYFESKEAFVCAVLDRYADELLRLIGISQGHLNDQELRLRLLGIFSAWDQLQKDNIFRGCLLLSAGVASGDPNDPARQTAIRHMRRIVETIERIASAGQIPHTARFATRFNAILDSSLISRQLFGDQLEAKEIYQMAEQLIAESIRERDASN